MNGKRTKVFVIVLSILTALLTCTKQPQQPLSDRIANYTINCVFDPSTKIIEAKQILHWTNASDDTLDELQFHNYMNAFQNERSTFWKEAGTLPPELIGNWGYCRIKSLKLSSSEDLTSQIRFFQPDDNNSDDKTVFSIPLPSPLLPDSSLSVSMEFETKLPPLTERAGYRDDFFIIAQWFPKIGVYERYRHRWSCHQYHYHSEFFADFGVYDVSITLPNDFLIAATGVVKEETELENGQKKWRFVAEDVHDFAWSADRNFEKSSISYKELEIFLYMHPESQALAERIVDAVKAAYDFCTDYLGEYPYPQISIVDTPVYASVMEYPMLFFTGNFDGSGESLAQNNLVPVSNKFLERATIHEFVHSWWYGMVASNEAEEAWLDEGLTEFTTITAFEKKYGPVLLNDENGDTLLIRDFGKREFLQNPTVIVNKKSWEYKTYRDYKIASYIKPRLILSTYDNYYGHERWQPVMRGFFQEWKFKHPITRNFIDTARNMTGHNLRAELRQLLESPHVVDYSIGSVSGKSIRLLKTGQLIFPVWVEVRFSDGSKVLKRWDKPREMITLHFTSKDAAITSVHIDPKNIVEFELDKSNNDWYLKDE